MSPDDRRRAIIDATIPLIRQHGFEISTRQIAEAAGVAEGTIFRVFDDKESLLSHAVHAALDPRADIVRLRAVDLSAPLAERVTIAAELLARRMTDVIALVVAVGRVNLVEFESEQRKALYAQFDAQLEVIFEPDRARLRFSPADAVRLLKIFAFGGSHPKLSSNRALNGAEIADVLLNGIVRADGDTAPTRQLADNLLGDLQC